MEQKTEAPQAVDGQINANDLERMAKERPGECFLKGSGILKLTGAIRTLEAEVAVLKAQPASTEEHGNKLMELFKHTLGSLAHHDRAEAERIAKLYWGDAVIPAQGEDSARLDAERYRFATGIDGDRVHIDWSASKEEIDATIDRARASAETGGVKP